MTGFKVRGVEEVQAFLKTVPHGSKRAIIEAAADWFIGNPNRGLRHYEPYKKVTPFRSYSLDPAKAARQRAWIFANLDKIYSGVRTRVTADAWEKRQLGKYNIRLENSKPAAQHLWDDQKQTRHHKAVGHRTVSSKIASNMAGALRHMKAAVRDFLKNKR